MDNTLIQLAVSVVAGAMAGGLTNHVAVWMLFHPHERRFGLQGAIPKNKERLAKSLGRTVGEKLLAPADLIEELSHSGVREAFDERIAAFVSELLNTERGSLREMLNPTSLAEVEQFLATLAGSITTGVEKFVDSDEFRTHVATFVARARLELDQQSLGDLLSAEQREDLAERARLWTEEFSRSEELEKGVRQYLERRSSGFLASTEPLVDRIPPSVLNAVESVVENYLPIAASKLGQFLSNPTAREKIRDALHGLFRRLVNDLHFHQRIIARLMVTEKTFDQAINALETEGVEQLAALLEDDAVREELTRVIREAILSFLQKPVSEIVGDAASARSGDLVQTIGDHLLAALRDERTHAFVRVKLLEVLERAEKRSLGDIIKGISDESLTNWLTAGAKTERARRLVRSGLLSMTQRLLDARIGRPSRWLAPESAEKFSATLSPALWDWIQSQLPQMIQRLDLEAIVERKVLGFSTERMEQIVRGVTERELRLIVKLGYLLGAIIGVTTFAVTRIFA